MDFENLLENVEIDDAVTFLSYYIPMRISKSNDKQETISKEQIDKLIEKGPSSYISEDCIKACEKLWENNIYALASLEMNGDLYLILDELDKENTSIFKKKIKENKINYCTNLGKEKCNAIRVPNYKDVGNLKEKFYELASIFKMQDIQRGYLNEKTFLMNVCDCEKVEGISEYKKNDLKIVFDIEKMEKTFKEYLKDSGYERFYVPEEHRIYINDYYYNAHKNYLNSKILI